MHLKYLKEQLFECYTRTINLAVNALDIFSESSEFAAKFRKLSENEAANAEIFYKMFLELYATSTSDAYNKSLRDVVMAEHSERTQRLTELKDAYKAMTSIKKISDEVSDGKKTV